MEIREKDQISSSVNKPGSKVILSFLIPGIIVAFLLGSLGGYFLRKAIESSGQISIPQPTTVLLNNLSPIPTGQKPAAPEVLPTVAVSEWKTGLIPSCGFSFKYPAQWQYHLNTIPAGDRGVTFQVIDSITMQGKELHAYFIIGSMGCDPQDFYNDYKSIESQIRKYGSGKVERLADNKDGIHIESPQRDEGYYMSIQNGLTIFIYYRNDLERQKYMDNGQVAEQILKSITFQK